MDPLPCGANFSTTGCLQPCVDPITAFQPQNVFACMSEVQTGLLQIAADIVPWNPVVEVVNACMMQYCDFADRTVGGCPYDGVVLDFNIKPNTLPWQVGFTATWLCKDVDNKINPDIGGIGVIVSYVLQVNISILLFLAVRLVGFLLFWSKSASRMSFPFRSRLARQEGVLKAIVVEFQEAQCFFMLACQTAVFAIINALAKNPQFLGTETMNAVKYNLAMARLVCLGGIVPVAFVLYIIHTVDMSSLVICALSGLTIVLASSALFTIPTDLSSASLSPLPYQSKLDKCGKNAPPVVYCQGMPISNRELDILMVLCCATVYLVICSSCIRSYVGSRTSQSDKQKRNKVFSCVATACDRLGSITSGQKYVLRFWDIPIIFPLVMYCLQFRFALADGVIAPSAWSFGQIVAVAVWFQVIMKYMYWSAFGVRGHPVSNEVAENGIHEKNSGDESKTIHDVEEAANRREGLPYYKENNSDDEERQ